MESTRTNKADLEASWEEMKELINNNLPKGSDVGSRTKEIWKVIGWFAMRYMETYFPGEEYLPWMMDQIKQDVVMQEEVDIVTEFFNKIASSQVAARPLLTAEHVTTDGKKLYIWFPGTIDAMGREIEHMGHARSTIRTAITEEPYYAGETTHRMGTNNHQRRVLSFDLANAPAVVKEIANVSQDSIL